MKKSIAFSILLALFVLCVCAACTTEVDETTEIVTVQIVDAKHTVGSLVYIQAGDVLIPMQMSDTYKIYVSYQGDTYSFDGKSVYKKYCNRIGEYVHATLQTTTYSNGDTRFEILECEGMGTNE